MTDLAEATAAVTYGSPRLRELIEHIAQGALGRDERDELPFEAIDAVRRARLGAIRLPVAQGGGASLIELYKVFIELSAADSNVAHILRSHFGVVENLLRGTGPGAARWLEHVARGELIGSATTELGAKAGATDFPYETTITQTPDSQRLNGTKHYTTGSLYMDWLLVSATGVDGEKTQLIIPGDRPGVHRPNDWDGFGQRFTGSGTVTFENVAIHPEDYFGTDASAGDTLPYPATFFHIQLNAMIAGILRRVASDAVEQVHRRTRAFYHANADTPADDPIVQYSVGLLHSQAFTAEALVLTAGAALQEAYAAHGTPEEAELSLRAALLNAKAKVVIDELANRAASELFDVGGGSLVRRSAHLDRHWRNIRAIAAHNPKTLKAVAVGRHALHGTPPPNQGFF
ncbi:acyl-CoA dehydrogenase [Frankia sp. EI5c]|uniref:acyl-CoA dehydrogenase family protein n=1 Tax=Frankia sp. EI5c TaxID=683316 RepID=UPI0007C332E5|nr:acyl-CoA dehydrogenase family protein [Frankia sp. EI5c]OAA26163.1 acyl-CoA dehydrogenase [Frankia sp. EI5c]